MSLFFQDQTTLRPGPEVFPVPPQAQAASWQGQVPPCLALSKPVGPIKQRGKEGQLQQSSKQEKISRP